MCAVCTHRLWRLEVLDAQRVRPRGEVDDSGPFLKPVLPCVAQIATGGMTD